MTNPVLGELQVAVDKTEGVMESATVLINGFAARLQAAIDEALANGATAEELAPFVDEVAQLNAGADALAAAVASNP